MAAYNAAKGAVVNLTRAMALDHAPRSGVNVVHPGFTLNTGITAGATHDTPVVRSSAERIPFGMFRSDPLDYDHDLAAQKKILKGGLRRGHWLSGAAAARRGPGGRGLLLRLGQPDPHARLAHRPDRPGRRRRALRGPALRPRHLTVPHRRLLPDRGTQSRQGVNPRQLRRS
ncbi:SDR family oxidoreductase [Streptomyces sp. NPDC094147]|uniref:SDR family oxidoreductase n=1 Tax=Streptomyces sp. NPDC094147 TaxID=3366057 RepID=UPI003822CB3F